eukprot:1157356-Pelagomonas_calceolata.AAC.10
MGKIRGSCAALKTFVLGHGCNQNLWPVAWQLMSVPKEKGRSMTHPCGSCTGLHLRSGSLIFCMAAHVYTKGRGQVDDASLWVLHWTAPQVRVSNLLHGSSCLCQRKRAGPWCGASLWVLRWTASQVRVSVLLHGSSCLCTKTQGDCSVSRPAADNLCVNALMSYMLLACAVESSSGCPALVTRGYRYIFCLDSKVLTLQPHAMQRAFGFLN